MMIKPQLWATATKTSSSRLNNRLKNQIIGSQTKKLSFLKVDVVLAVCRSCIG
ncbi:hypothetical protein CICLE_v10003080mg [Citrus x clementina]|uniref:Uncharacterized protein n=1 Tax=Citrus clementina TaxID=85681 RepID=V4SE64_CITCL|nr:hypothetical protein CICLE_v10003080mg [Citrus x clementina]ESR45908.1 hypothetical protein CICLE_v10003080mg [Citrus x clementina]